MMEATNMETITRSMKNCSVYDRRKIIGDGFKRSEKRHGDSSSPISDRTLELNSHLSLPCHWEQCLDLKTGEIYYINWKNGMRVKEDPRKVIIQEDDDDDDDSGESYGTMCTEEEEEEEDSSYYDSEVSSSSDSSRDNHKEEEVVEEEEEEEDEEEEDVLVVGGCKACFMYFMVPKLVEDCPKCESQLLHFDKPLKYASP